METLSSVAKRKKRKTRKCLDEIRKRSRRTKNDSIEVSPLINMRTKTTNVNGNKRNVCITSDRLTLAMFPKVIRSETITRPIQSEISEESVMNFERIIKNTKITSNEPSNEYKINEPSQSDSDYIIYSDDNSISSGYERFSTAAGTMSPQKDSDSRNLSTQDNSPGSFLLFSPADQREGSEPFKISPETLSTTSASTQSSEGICGYQLYEEFMNELPIYIRQNAPALIKDDVMKKTKTLLHNMYLESSRRESEENLFHCSRKRVVNNKCFTPNTPASATESPVMEYLHLGRTSRPRAEPARRRLYETPDYTYYPHKLNQ